MGEAIDKLEESLSNLPHGPECSYGCEFQRRSRLTGALYTEAWQRPLPECDCPQADAEKALGTLRAQLAEKDREIERLRGTVAGLQSDYDSRMEDLKDADAQLSASQAREREAVTEAAELRASLQSAKEETDEVRAELEVWLNFLRGIQSLLGLPGGEDDDGRQIEVRITDLICSDEARDQEKEELQAAIQRAEKAEGSLEMAELALDEFKALAEYRKTALAAARKALEARRHAMNEWADAASNGLQWLRNIRDGISSAEEAINNMDGNIQHCMEVARAALNGDSHAE